MEVLGYRTDIKTCLGLPYLTVLRRIDLWVPIRWNWTHLPISEIILNTDRQLSAHAMKLEYVFLRIVWYWNFYAYCHCYCLCIDCLCSWCLLMWSVWLCISLEGGLCIILGLHVLDCVHVNAVGLLVTTSTEVCILDDVTSNCSVSLTLPRLLFCLFFGWLWHHSHP
jgi:hypothetical protein